jgi:hypothetical protein
VLASAVQRAETAAGHRGAWRWLDTPRDDVALVAVSPDLVVAAVADEGRTRRLRPGERREAALEPDSTGRPDGSSRRSAAAWTRRIRRPRTGVLHVLDRDGTLAATYTIPTCAPR